MGAGVLLDIRSTIQAYIISWSYSFCPLSMTCVFLSSIVKMGFDNLSQNLGPALPEHVHLLFAKHHVHWCHHASLRHNVHQFAIRVLFMIQRIYAQCKGPPYALTFLALCVDSACCFLFVYICQRRVVICNVIETGANLTTIGKTLFTARSVAPHGSCPRRM